MHAQDDLQLSPSEMPRYELVKLRIQSDGVRGAQAEANFNVTPGAQDITTATPVNPGEGPPLNSAPSLPPPRTKDTDPVYTEAVTVSGSKAVHRQPATEFVVYDDIKAFKNKDVQCVKKLDFLVIVLIF